MIERLFPRPVLIFLAIFAGVAFLFGLIAALVRGDSVGDVFISAFEAAILAAIGGLLARSFISFLLWTGRDNENVSFFLGWAFFLWPGLIDTIPKLLGRQYLTRTAWLLWFAVSVGAFTGMMDGAWRMHNWAGWGWAAFPLDTTWGLTGTTQGDLLHVYNFFGGDHAVDQTRTDAHHYNSGFVILQGGAFTQGAVMSGSPFAVTSATFAHENTHILQTRLFGPFYTWTYVVWLLLWLIPGLIVGAAIGDVGGGITSWSYLNNPWETWGYAVGQGLGFPPRTTFGPAVWPDVVVWIVAVPYFLLCLAAAGWLVYRTWSRARA